jgi:phosphonate transport system permease protein
VIGVGIGQMLAWLYEIFDRTATVAMPALIGGLVGLAVGVWGMRRGQLGSGLGIYYLFRTLFNTLRSIEALILALVFVIWVGLGAFAGTLALALHTIAANAKLYSEQVESISSGPLEAVRATGATRLQTVVYAVVPQIVAPFIAFTMYRWDINVRMSTIIGFVGGGGIGLILQQNINLLNYRGAAAQILAIAIVVAAMDYVSSRLRERYL